MSKAESRTSRPSWAGIGPETALKERLSAARLRRLPRSDGMVPERALEERSRDWRAVQLER